MNLWIIVDSWDVSVGTGQRRRAQVEKVSQTFFSECAKKSNTLQVYVHFIFSHYTFSFALPCSNIQTYTLWISVPGASHRIIHISMVVAEGYDMTSNLELGIWRNGQDVTLCASWRSDGKLLLVGEAGGSCVPWHIMSGKKIISSWELTYPPKMAIWRWFSFSPGGIY